MRAKKTKRLSRPDARTHTHNHMYTYERHLQLAFSASTAVAAAAAATAAEAETRRWLEHYARRKVCLREKEHDACTLN